MSETYTAENDSSPLDAGYPIGKIALAILLAAVLHGVLLGSSLLVGSSKKTAEQATAKGSTVSVVSTNAKTGTETATAQTPDEKKSDAPKAGGTPKGDPADDLKLEEK